MGVTILALLLFAVFLQQQLADDTSPNQASVTASSHRTRAPRPSVRRRPPRSTGAGRLFQWRVQGNVTIQETAGLGANFASITVTNFNPPIVYTSDVIAQRSGTNHVAAKGSLVVPVTVIYGLVDNPAANRAIVMSFVVSFTDEKGNQESASAQWTTN